MAFSWKKSQERDIRKYKRRAEQQQKCGDTINAKKTQNKIEEMKKNAVP